MLETLRCAHFLNLVGYKKEEHSSQAERYLTHTSYSILKFILCSYQHFPLTSFLQSDTLKSVFRNPFSPCDHDYSFLPLLRQWRVRSTAAAMVSFAAECGWRRQAGEPRARDTRGQAESPPENWHISQEWLMWTRHCHGRLNLPLGSTGDQEWWQ